ncbi:MAG TPA: lytic transglycosylase domain-containing protein [Thermoanaerobaculia bacterium]|nr:lytic transglycosylase domain-containing protein [Thermoanaerobaculia bacterium]
MRKRLWISVGAGAAVLAAIAILAIVISQQRLRRHRVFRAAPAERRAKPPAGIPPVERWTEEFERLSPTEVEELLDQIEQHDADLYARYSLGYLHARVLIERNELRDAARKLAPFLDAKSAFRDLALYHQAEIDQANDDRAAASRVRQQLIAEYPQAFYRDQAIDEEADYLQSLGDPSPLVAFVRAVTPAASTARRRELSARIVESQLRAGQLANAFAGGIALLKGGTTDDAADRVSRALDRSDLVARMNAEQKATIGDALRNHRRFDRAVVLLNAALSGLPARRDELLFDIGRSYFGDEKYAEAQQTYMRGANTAVNAKAKATFLFHASRAAQLRGDDAGAERLMTATIAVVGRFPATTAALTQRIRTRLKQKRFADAATDLQLLRKIAPNDHAVVEGSLAYASGVLGAGKSGTALSVLNSVPRKLLDKSDVPEYGYWRARALESRDLHAAFNEYLGVLRSTVSTHFAYFARERLESAAMQSRVTQELIIREAQVRNLIASKQFAVARQIETDRILLSSRNRSPELQRLADIYRQTPAYKNILELQPEPLPRLPNVNPNDRATLLMALGLYDEAADQVRQHYPLRPLKSALTQSIAFNRGGASRESIYAVEVLMKSAPADYLPDLLPLIVRQLLYPRYFYGFIVEDSQKFGTDPTLVLAIMREESRFNPRAKSEAAARGLLQFIITTAREIGRDVGLIDVAPEDLYDPRVIIKLGAKYVSELSKQFDGNSYRTAAAYNAGPKQVALWLRLAPAAGDDWFFSAINFDETKDYVRKVMNSYRRYNEIYGNAGPQGGLRAEP